MAAGLYSTWIDAQHTTAPIDLGSATQLQFALINTTGGATQYTFDTTHSNLTDVPAGARYISAGVYIQSPTFGVVSSRTFSCADYTFPAVPDVDPYEALIMFNWGGTDASSQLIYYEDDPAVVVDPNGGDINVIINPAGLFTLSFQ